MSKVTSLGPLNAATPLTIPTQMLRRIQEAQKEGREVHVVGVVIEKTPNNGNAYTVYYSTMRVEMLAWAAYEIDRQAKSRENMADPPRPEVG